MKTIAVYALTPLGARLASEIALEMGADLYLPTRLAGAFDAFSFEGIMEAIRNNFTLYPHHVFIAASGIVVRMIAPLLRSKDQDPAVVVLDHEGKHCISLLSGHLGGANELARRVARVTGGEAVITTATDTLGVQAIDLLAKEKDLFIENLTAVRQINMALLNGDIIQIFDPEDRLDLKNPSDSVVHMKPIHNKDEWCDKYPGVWVTWQTCFKGLGNKCLVLHPRCLVAGVGCNRGTEAEEIVNFIRRVFSQNRLAIESLKCLSTIEAKRDEAGLLRAAEQLNVPLEFKMRSEIEPVEVPNPSGVVQKHMGVPSVCEASAILAAGAGRLLVPKTKSGNVTLALALAA